MAANRTEVRAGRRAATPPLDRAVIITGLVVICGQIMAILDKNDTSVNVI